MADPANNLPGECDMEGNGNEVLVAEKTLGLEGQGDHEEQATPELSESETSEGNYSYRKPRDNIDIERLDPSWLSRQPQEQQSSIFFDQILRLVAFRVDGHHPGHLKEMFDFPSPLKPSPDPWISQFTAPCFDMDDCIRDFSGSRLAKLADLMQAVILKRARVMNEKLWRLYPEFYLLEIAQSLLRPGQTGIGELISPDEYARQFHDMALKYLHELWMAPDDFIQFLKIRYRIDQIPDREYGLLIEKSMNEVHISKADLEMAEQGVSRFTRRRLHQLWNPFSRETYRYESSQDILDRTVDSVFWSSLTPFLEKYLERYREHSTTLLVGQNQRSRPKGGFDDWKKIFDRDWKKPGKNFLSWDVREEIWAAYQEGPDEDPMTAPTELSCEWQILTANVRSFCEHAGSPEIVTDALANLANLRKALATQMVDFRILYEEIGKLRDENQGQTRAIAALSSRHVLESLSKGEKNGNPTRKWESFWRKACTVAMGNPNHPFHHFVSIKPKSYAERVQTIGKTLYGTLSTNIHKFNSEKLELSKHQWDEDQRAIMLALTSGIGLTEDGSRDWESQAKKLLMPTPQSNDAGEN